MKIIWHKQDKKNTFVNLHTKSGRPEFVIGFLQ